MIRGTALSLSAIMSIRLCHAGDLDIFFVRNEYTGHFDGGVGSLTSDFIDFTNRISNGSLLIDAEKIAYGVGERRADGSYDGCIGRLQSNESDFLLYTVDYPIEADNVTQDFLLFDEFMVIGQNYFIKSIVKDGQVFDLIYNCNPIILYIALFLFSVICAIALRRKLFKRERYNHATYDVIAHSVRISTIRDTNLFYRILFISLSLFSLLVIHYNNSLIKTSLVVVRDPDLFTSYSEIIDKKIKPFFIEGLNSEYYFKHAPADSMRGRIWNHSISNWHLSELIATPSPQGFLSYGLGMASRKQILLVDSMLAQVIGMAACQFRAREISPILSVFADQRQQTLENVKRLNSFHFHSVVDESERPFQKGIVFSEFFTSPLARTFKRRIRYSIENGLPLFYVRQVQNNDIFAAFEKVDIMKSDPKKFRYVRDCISETIVTPSVSYVDEIDFVNFAKLIAVCATMMAVASVTLMLEIVACGIERGSE